MAQITLIYIWKLLYIYIALHLHYIFKKSYSMQKFQNILSLSPNNCGPLRDTKISNFFHTVFHDASLKS